jgi:3'-phosphoadenosine 5'-phosphosulfate sulfotransferase (PAPS reductase)/FAD synthetase
MQKIHSDNPETGNRAKLLLNAVSSKILVSRDELKRRQELPLQEKISWALGRYIEYYEIYHKQGVYISFSGGKDSQVLCDMIDRLHDGEMDAYLHFSDLYMKNYLKINSKNKPPKVFCDTGLEFPEIRKHVKSFNNVVWLKPKQLWTDVVLNIGFLIGSKKTSRMLQDIRNPKETNQKSRTLYLTGIKSDGTQSKSFKLAKLWKPLINAPFQVSGKCCDIFKKEPFKVYEKETKRKPISATTTDEGDMRRISYMQTGCNSFGDKPMSRPLSIWLEKDIWNYHDLMNIKFADVYYSREVEFFENDGTLTKKIVDGEKRTGCMFCLIGSPKQIEKRFDRLKETHQKQYNFLMDGKINMRQVFEFIGIKSKLL